MQELINLVAQKTGQSAEQVALAVQIVINYLKIKLPSPVAGQLDALLTNEAIRSNRAGR